jgi:hypothetical protein
MKLIKFKFTALMVLLIFLHIPNSVFTQPLQLGQSLVTSFDRLDPLHNVLRVVDIRNRPPFVVNGSAWNPPQTFGANWTNQRMNSVFGIATDHEPEPNIYVASSTVYCSDPHLTPGHIYKIIGNTWAVTDYVVTNNIPGPPMTGVNWIPNTGPGLGNICHDRFHNQQFVTNHEDGRIYRIADNGMGMGIVQSFFDPFGPDNNSAGFAPRGERLWGIGVYGTNSSDVRVYFSRWRADRSVTNTLGDNEIWSIALDNAGEFITSDVRLELNLPVMDSSIPALNYSNPASDIEFSFNGDMLLGERTMSGNVGPCSFSGAWAHQSRILEFPRDGTGLYQDNNFIWHRVGVAAIDPRKSNSCGGVDFGYGFYDTLTQQNDLCDSIITGTGDRIFDISPGLVYGFQVTERSSAGIYTHEDFSLFVDLNGVFSGFDDKQTTGDIDVYREDLCRDTNDCISIIRDTVYCDSAGNYIYQFQVLNQSATQSIEQIELVVDTPQPPNYVVAVPSTFIVSPPLPPGAVSNVYTVNLVGPGAVAQAEVCYTLSVHFVNDDCPWCCYIENCIKLPECGDCAEVIQDSIYCVNGDYFFNFTLQNGTLYNVSKVQITSPGFPGVYFIPQTFTFSPAILPGQTFPSLTSQLNGVSAGMTIPVQFKLFDGNNECCYFLMDYTIPPCDTSFSDCECGDWITRGYRRGNDTTTRPFDCGSSISVPLGSAITLIADYSCNPNDTNICGDSYDLTLVGGGTSTTINSNNILNYSFVVNTGYTATIITYCGGVPCDTCIFKVNPGPRTGSLDGSKFGIEQNYPNPFNPSTVINFAVPELSSVDLKIYDTSGRLVMTLINNVKYDQGVHNITFDAGNLASGIYFYKFKANNYVETKKMLLIK